MKKIAAIVLATAVTMGSFASTASVYVSVNGYWKNNGTYVMLHIRTAPYGNP